MAPPSVGSSWGLRGCGAAQRLTGGHAALLSEAISETEPF